jgi:hypothetical protein
MSDLDPKDLDRVDQAIRINELKCEAEELAGGQMATWESEDMPPDMSEQFWRHVVDYENAPDTSLYHQMVEGGLELPEPDTLTDKQVAAKLKEMFEWMAARRHFISATDHLSDRELYTLLVEETLHEVMKDMPYDEYSAYEIDLVSNGSDESTHLYLKHYADEESRKHWQESFPDYNMPPHEDPPYDRDRTLPKATYPGEDGTGDATG